MDDLQRARDRCGLPLIAQCAGVDHRPTAAPDDILKGSGASHGATPAQLVHCAAASTRRASLRSTDRATGSEVAELWHAAVPDGPGGDQDRTQPEGPGRRPEKRSWRAQRPDAE
jgi:hypothetical protein